MTKRIKKILNFDVTASGGLFRRRSQNSFP
jgi:hypothetical protein